MWKPHLGHMPDYEPRDAPVEQKSVDSVLIFAVEVFFEILIHD